jgi:hypothetical protein
MQKPASFNLEAVKEKVQAMIEHHEGQQRRIPDRGRVARARSRQFRSPSAPAQAAHF